MATSSSSNAQPLLNRCMCFQPDTLQTSIGVKGWAALMQEALEKKDDTACKTLVRAFVDIRPPLDLSEEKRVIFGGFNQFKNGGSNACTFCAQIFLLTVFKKGLGGMSSEVVNQIVDRGLAIYEVGQEVRKANKDVKMLWESPDSEAILGLTQLDSKIWPEMEKYKMLPGQKGSALEHFKNFLASLEQVATQVGSFGVVITNEGKTSSLVVFRHENSFRYGLFDSHGNSEINPKSKNAFVLCSSKRNEIAEGLLKLFPPKDNPKQINTFLVRVEEEIQLPNLETSHKTYYLGVGFLALTIVAVAQKKGYLNFITDYTDQKGQTITPLAPRQIPII
ncbi:hypothetical protein [Candidatus Neptunochlamydia vexilliferae]|uniref:Uncharacterized protein n=1 Tax=Candidatus Neptunichlamydia vexilliferae TaxID=1651774 RepID=A0ABS0B075_9BACT|nr:hypothetical protein [Candidatus Neptunochlamydia vexilliferae]MBF5058975.1 hypothetical protein [Candidatus Neptunochlamydia vexilliferae]